MTDNSGASYGPTDVAFIGGTLYVLIEMGGCSHALPDDLPAILRVNRDGSTTHVANLNAWHAANPPNFIKDTNPATTDQEPGGVFHSMIALGKYLYVVETNRGFLLRVDPRTGVIETLYDMSIDNREHNPIVMTQRGNNFFVGTFGEDQGPSELAVFDKYFSGYTLPFKSRNPIVGLAWHCNDLYGVEIFPYDNQWSTDSANLVTFDRKTGKRDEGADRVRQPPERARGGPRRCVVHVELGHFVRTRTTARCCASCRKRCIPPRTLRTCGEGIRPPARTKTCFLAFCAQQRFVQAGEHTVRTFLGLLPHCGNHS